MVLAAGLVVWAAVDDDVYTAPRPEARSTPTGADAATEALQRLETAVRSGDSRSAKDLAADMDGAADLITAIVENAEKLRVQDFDLRYVDQSQGPDERGIWAAAVDVTWRFAGFDSAAAISEVQFSFQTAEGQTRVAGVGGGGARTPVWLSGPVSVSRTPQTLVLTAGPEARLERIVAEARAAVGQVTAVLQQWDPRLVVEVPSSPTALDAALGAEQGEYGAIAAVTSAPDGNAAPGTPVHIFLNPDVYGGLGRTGAQVVMTHEAVHVATEAPNTVMPQWLMEGFADYVALRAVDLPLSTTAAQVIEQVRDEGPPDQLPGPVEFDTKDSHLGAAYEAAWVACEVLAERSNESTLVRLYRSVRDGERLGEALERLYGWSEEDLVAAWQDRLVQIADG